MRVLSLLAAMLLSLAAAPALAQAPPEGIPTPVRGTVEKLDGQNLTVKACQVPSPTTKYWSVCTQVHSGAMLFSSLSAVLT